MALPIRTAPLLNVTVRPSVPIAHGTTDRVTVQWSDERDVCLAVAVVPREYWVTVLLPVLEHGARAVGIPLRLDGA